MADDEIWKEDAYLAHASYTQADVDGYTRDPELSDEYSTTYVNKNSGKATIGFSGTNFKQPGWGKTIKRGAEDVTSDMYIVNGNEQDSPHFQNALAKTKKAIAKYGHENVRVTGHSLGGTTSTFVSSETGVNGTSFNMGWSPKDVVRHTPKVDLWDDHTNIVNIAKGTAPNHKWDFSHTDAYYTPGDPISTTERIQPGLRTHKINDDVKWHKFENDLVGKGAQKGVVEGKVLSAGMEAAGVNPYVAAGVMAYGTGKKIYTLGNDINDLHSSENFLFERPKITVPPRVSTANVPVSHPKQFHHSQGMSQGRRRGTH